MDYEKLKEDNLKTCSMLSGQDRHDFIEEVFEDYQFAIQYYITPKVKRYYRELLTELIKNFGN